MSENAVGVVLLTTLPEAHAMLIQSLRNRSVPVSVTRGGRQAQRLLRARPRVVVIDLVNRPALDRASIAGMNAARSSGRVVALHEGDLGSFPGELDDLVVDAFSRIGEWVPIVELALEGKPAVATARRRG